MKLFFLVGFIFVAFLVHTYAEETGAKDCIIDLQLIVDSSGSVGEDHFNQMMEDIAEKFLRSFHIGPLQTRVGLFQYSNLMRNEFDLDKFSDVESLIKATEAIKYIGGETYTGQAMNESLVHFEEKMRKDNETKKVCIVFTDGAPTERKEAIEIPEVTRKWRDLGVHVFAVGIGPDILHTGLVAIAGNEDNALSVVDFSNLTKSIEPLKKIICTLPQITSPPQYPANTTPIPPIPPIPSLDPTVKPPATPPPKCKGPCPGAACCSDCKVKVECNCHYDKRNPGFQFNVSVDDTSNSLWPGVWKAQFGPPTNTTPPCLSRTNQMRPSYPSRPWEPVTAPPYTKRIVISHDDCGTTTQVINSPFAQTIIRFSNYVRLWEDQGNGDFILDEYFVELQCDCIVEGNLIANYTLLNKTRIEKNESHTPLALTAFCGNLSCCLDEKTNVTENGRGGEGGGLWPVGMSAARLGAPYHKDTKEDCCKKNITECCLLEKITIKAHWVGGLPPFIKFPNQIKKLVIHALNCWAGDVVTGGTVTERVRLVTNGCFVKRQDRLGNIKPVFGLTGTTFGEFSFQAFRFRGSLPPHRVYIQCQMVVCEDGSCPILSLPGACMMPGRRKRSVDVGSYLAMQEVIVGPISITDAPNTSYAAKVVRPRRKFAGARRRLDQMMRKLGQ